MYVYVYVYVLILEGTVGVGQTCTNMYVYVYVLILEGDTVGVGQTRDILTAKLGPIGNLNPQWVTHLQSGNEDQR